MHLIRTVITVFHTDAPGNVDTDARLIPGLVKAGAGGQEAMRTALAAAAAAAGVGCTAENETLETVYSCTPHDMRRTVLSDLDRAGVKDSHIQRLAGHVPGTAVLHRHYLLDDPKLRPPLHIADLVERELLAEVPRGLLIPTMVRCTTGHQRSLAPDATRNA
jgi:integrase